MSKISYQLSNRFRLRSNSSIFVSLSHDNGFCTARNASLGLSRRRGTFRIPLMLRSSRTTILSCVKPAKCCSILSKPTSSTAFPLMWITAASLAISFNGVAYLVSIAPTKPEAGSSCLLGRMNEPADNEELLPSEDKLVGT